LHRHFNIVVAGEFNSGKSSVINLLLRRSVLPVSVRHTNMPPVRIFPSDREDYNIRSKTNEGLDFPSFKAGKIDGRTIQSARLEMELPQFNGATITEISVGEDGELEAEAATLMRDADQLIWCTMGQRAWCLTEIDVVENLPEKLLDNAILAVTRRDYLTSESDREKVRNRLHREAKQYFREIVMLDASPKSIRSAGDAVAWAASDGHQLHDYIINEFEKSEFYGAAIPVAKIQDIQDIRELRVESRRPAEALTPKEALELCNLQIGNIRKMATIPENLSGEYLVANLASALDIFKDRIEGAVNAGSLGLETTLANLQAASVQVDAFGSDKQAEAAMFVVACFVKVSAELTRMANSPST